MGTREGTKPEDDPLMRSQSARARTEGYAKGRLEAVVQVLEAPGIAVEPDIKKDRELLGGDSGEDLIAAALACTDADDFRRRVGQRHTQPPSSRASAEEVLVQFENDNGWHLCIAA